jgi:hypothetical protein
MLLKTIERRWDISQRRWRRNVDDEGLHVLERDGDRSSKQTKL